MNIEIILDGQKYVGKKSDELTQAKAVSAMYENWSDFNKLKVDLEDGSVMLIGKDAVQRAVVIVKP